MTQSDASGFFEAVGDALPAMRSTITFAAGSVIFREGEEGDCAYVVERGLLRGTRRSDGRDRVLGSFGPGDLIGELGLLERGIRATTVTALSDCELLVVSRDQVARELPAGSTLVKLLLRLLLRRFQVMAMAEAAGDETLVDIAADPEFNAHDTTHLKAIRDIRMEGQLRNAIARREFELHYQPIVSLATCRPIGFEALVRWIRPDEGMVMPSEFIPIAERSGLIVPLGAWVLEHAAHFAERMRKRSRQRDTDSVAPFVSVNVSPRQLEGADGLNPLLRAIRAVGVEAGAIKLEMTESVLVENPEASAAALRQLKATGVTLAVDDFGTGYASLSYLPRYPLDTLKIDQSFVSNIADHATRQVIRSMVMLAGGLGMDVVAEGVETREQLVALLEIGCDHGQGYLFSRPVTAEKALQLVASALPAAPHDSPG